MPNPTTPPNPNMPTSYGKPYNPSGIGATLFPKGTDPFLNYLPTKNTLQQLLQFSTAPQTLYNQYYGYQAPDINPVAQAEYKRLQEQIIPQLAGQLTTSGDQGAFMRSLRGAGGDIASKLAALQYEKQAEMNKLRQEQLPRFREQELSQVFQPHITNMPLKHPEPSEMEKGLKGAGAEALNIAGEAAQKGGEFAGRKAQALNQATLSSLEKILPKRAFDFIKKQNELLVSKGTAAYKTGKEAVGKATERLAGAYHEAAHPWQLKTLPALPKEASQNKSNVTKNIAEPFKKHINPTLAQYIDSKKLQEINRIARKRTRGESKGYDFFETLKYIKTPAQLDQWLKILGSGLKRDKTRKASLDKFLKDIGAL